MQRIGLLLPSDSHAFFHMTILQEQPPGPAVPSQIAATSLDPPRDLEYPHAPIAEKAGNSPMPLILWGLALLFGILMLLVRLPLNAPEFEQLTQYVCDPLPVLNGTALRAARSVVLTCRSDDKFVFQRGFPSYSINSAWNSCWRSGGLIRIWRVANPSPYGSYVFHATCDDHVITYYRARAASYESTQRFVIAVACIIILVSAIGLIHIRLVAHSTE
jgi:hypothetical protein